jgi:hypothetical protein
MFDFLLYHRFDDHGTVSRSVFVEVTCEQCSHYYGYALTRSQRAIGDRYVWQSCDKGKEKALSDARRDVDRKLARGVELVPCPRCGWIQARMLGRARDENYPIEGWPALFAFILATVALAALFVLWKLEEALQLNWVTAWVSLIATFALMVTVGLVCIAREALRARKYDPNSAPQEERIALGRSRSLRWEQFEAHFPHDAAMQIEEKKAPEWRTETSV